MMRSHGLSLLITLFSSYLLHELFKEGSGFGVRGPEHGAWRDGVGQATPVDAAGTGKDGVPRIAPLIYTSELTP